jgi:hypothetical protein
MEKEWTKVEVMCEVAKGIAFDTCHKIYILLDDAQMNQMKEYGYDPLISSDEMGPSEMFNTIRDWYDQSCMLRFVSAVRTVEGDPNDGFVNLIPQGFEE